MDKHIWMHTDACHCYNHPMVFSSSVFLFVFMPVVLVAYFIVPGRAGKNIWLLIASLFFYAWGEPKFVLVMMLSIVVNWLFGLLVDRYRASRHVRKLIALDVILNLSIIFIYKYLNFTVNNLNALFHAHIDVPAIALPIGISFFTFQALSYVIDVYRGKGTAQKNILNVGLYISFFPQLIAGPIVRYETIAEQIHFRKENLRDFSDGVVRFILGLGKKVIIANNMALIADKAFLLSGGAGKWFGVSMATISPAMAWLGALAYTFQIYYDFSGYSDMAIGLGRMFGFHFDENFNYPYVSRSITEFWRRWHISLSTWFRDYVYISLGGNRVASKRRHMFNLFVVWLCTGIWHGANWTFILWGLFYFVLLVIEKNLGLHKDGKTRLANAAKYVLTMLFVILGWVLFRADNVGAALLYMKQMFVPGGPLVDAPAVFYLRQYWAFFLLGAVFSYPVLPKIRERFTASPHAAVRTAYDGISAVLLLGILLIAVSYIVIGSYNPFIYFNF